MRFLILTQYYPPEVGAAQVRLSSVARVLRLRGHDVEVVTALPNYPTGHILPGYRRQLAKTEVIDGIRVRRVWLLPATGSGMARMGNYLSFTATSLAALATMRRPDVIFVESPPPTLAITGWLMARRWNIPFVLNISDLWPDSALELGLIKDGVLARAARRLESWAYGHASFVTAVTAGIRSSLIEEKRVPARKVLFLRNGVDTDLFAPLPSDMSLTSDLGLAGRHVILLAGTVGFGQGIGVVIDAAERLSQRPITFLIAGGGSERERLRHLTSERRITNVQFLDPRPPAEIGSLYSIATAGLVTLRDVPVAEGAVPARTLAAMACAKPVIYSGAGEGARLVAAADAGIVVPPEDPDALAGAVASIVDDPRRAAEMGRNGRALIESRFSWNAIVDAWLSELEAGLLSETAG
jgi:glycosyltransferase involved in cell wall biosynthesis